MKAFDPLGLVTPTKMIGSLLFRCTLQAMKKAEKGRIPWDEVLPEALISEWLIYLDMLKVLENVKFPRSFRPANSDPNCPPELVTFADGSPDCYGAVVYGRWTLKDSSRVVRLITSKAKLAPLLKKGETVRNELNGATFAARLKSWVVTNSGVEFGKHIPIVDSRIIQDMIKKDSYWYNTFAGVRVSEIQSKTNVNEWLHVPSSQNIADILTKGAPPSDLVEGSIWQNGPSWLLDDVSCWPITDLSSSAHVDSEIAKFHTVDRKLKSALTCSSFGAVDILSLPEEEKSFTASSNVIRSVSRSNISKQFDLLELLGSNEGRYSKLVARFSDLPKLIRAMAYVMRFALKKKQFGAVSCVGRSKADKEISAKEYNDAWLLLVHLEQKVRLKEDHVKKLVPKKVTVQLASYDLSVVLIVVGGRVSNFPVGFDGMQEVPVVPYGPLARLIMLHYHDKLHRDVDTVVAVARADVWIVKARKLASEWDNRCKLCLIKRQKTASQQMGDLPSSRTVIKPAWTSVNLDLFGPFLIRDDCVKKGPRVFKKVWGVIFACTLTRGVYLDVAVDYSTEAVLHTIRRLMACKGDVRLIISDPGSQLKGACKELSSWRKGWDVSTLKRFGAEKGLDWQFVMSDSQHQNGAVEILVKMVKGVRKSFLKSMGTNILSLNEVMTLMTEVSNLVNERPIGVKPNSNTHPAYLSPNSLFLGRCSEKISSGPFDSSDMYTEDPKAWRSRFKLVQLITDQFWKNWVRFYFPSLLVRHKWHTSRRNVAVGDVVLVQDEDAFRSNWRLGKVLQVFPDRRGFVRNVVVQVKSKQENSVAYKSSKGYELSRHVSKLIVLVPIEDQEEDVVGAARSDSSYEPVHDVVGEVGAKVDEESGRSVNATHQVKVVETRRSSLALKH